MPTLADMPPSKDKKRFEVHFTEAEVKEFEKLLTKYPRTSMKALMETLLLDALRDKRKKKK